MEAGGTRADDQKSESPLRTRPVGLNKQLQGSCSHPSHNCSTIDAWRFLAPLPITEVIRIAISKHDEARETWSTMPACAYAVHPKRTHKHTDPRTRNRTAIINNIITTPTPQQHAAARSRSKNTAKLGDTHPEGRDDEEGRFQQNKSKTT